MSFDPDYKFEDFWITFKSSIINFYYIFNKKKVDNVLKLSDELNELKKQENYYLIEYKIHEFITDYSTDIFNCIDNLDKDNYSYHVRIFFSNIKRWKHLRENRIFFKDPIKHENMYYLMIDILRLSIKHQKNNEIKIKEFFINAEKIINSYNFKIIVDYLLEMKIYSILDDIKPYYNYIEYISEKFNIDLDVNTSGRKIIKKLEINNLI